MSMIEDDVERVANAMAEVMDSYIGPTQLRILARAAIAAMGQGQGQGQPVRVTDEMALRALKILWPHARAFREPDYRNTRAALEAALGAAPGGEP